MQNISIYISFIFYRVIELRTAIFLSLSPVILVRRNQFLSWEGGRFHVVDVNPFVRIVARVLLGINELQIIYLI